MTAFTAIDLSKLPPPSIVEELNYETILTNILTDLTTVMAGLDPEFDGNSVLESDPMMKVLQVVAYRELYLRQRINEAARSVMLATAQGEDLENLAALFGVVRENVDPNDPTGKESDTRLRERTRLALEGFSTTGPEGAYIFHALSADSLVKDVSVTSPSPGTVRVVVLSHIGNGDANNTIVEDEEGDDITLVEKVLLALNGKEIRPITDEVVVEGAEIINYQVEAELTVFSGPGAEAVRLNAEAAVQEFVRENHRLNYDITVSGLHAALHQAGVQDVKLKNFLPDSDPDDPLENLVIESHQAAYCDSNPLDENGDPNPNYGIHITLFLEQLSGSNVRPIFGAKEIQFEDQDVRAGYLQGEIRIIRADIETNITHYRLYWGADPITKLQLIHEFDLQQEPENQPLVYTLPSTEVPAGANYFLVVSVNNNLEIKTPTVLGPFS